MELRFYNLDINAPFDSWSSVVNIKNTLGEDLEFDFEGEQFVIKKGETKSYPAKLGVFVSAEITRRRLAKENRAFSEPKFKDYFLENFGSKNVDFEKMDYAELKEKAKEKGIDIANEEGKMKKAKVLIEELKTTNEDK